MGTALVTGASAGMGREFAVQLAAKGHDLVLVARNADRLQALADELSTSHGIQAEVLSADLSDREQVQRVADRLADPARPIDLLVNNAGFGIRHGLVTGDLAEEERAIEVMVRAVLVLSHAAAGPMKTRGHGAILNVSSVAAYAVMGTYSAIKAWVSVFSEALAGELSGTGVSVTAVCPGFVRTEFHQRAEMSMSRLPDALWLEPADVVRTALRDLSAGRVVSVPSAPYKALTVAIKLVPRSLTRAASSAISSRRRGSAARTGRPSD